MDPLGHSLDLLRDTYNYNHWIYSLLRPHSGNSVLEIGAGIGNLTQFFLGVQSIVCVEPDDVYWARLAAFVAPHANVRALHMPLEKSMAAISGLPAFDSVVCVNVLEHIKDDVGAVRLMLQALKPDGSLMLYVPAGQWAYGEMDLALGHYLRYDRRRLRLVVEEAGGHIALTRYVNFVGLFGWWWSGRIQKECTIDVRKARFMDRIVPLVSSVERIIRPPIGQSLFAVIKPGAASTQRKT